MFFYVMVNYLYGLVSDLGSQKYTNYIFNTDLIKYYRTKLIILWTNI